MLTIERIEHIEKIKGVKGFTLIELVIVIVLIGILAATALPKFANLTTQARNAANQGIAGSLAAGVSIAHAAWIAAGASTSGTGSTVTLETGNVHVNSNGWPDWTTTPMGVANATTGGCTGVLSDILNSAPTGYTVNVAGAVCTFTTANNQMITYNIGTGAVGSTNGT